MKRFFTASGTNDSQTNNLRFFASEFWICFRVLGLLHPTIFCFWVLGLFSSFGFVSNIQRTHHDAQRLPHFFFWLLGLFPSFGFVSNIPCAHHDAQRPPNDFLFVSFGFVSNIPLTHHDFMSAKLEQYKNGGFHSKLGFNKCVSFYVSYQPDVQI